MNNPVDFIDVACNGLGAQSMVQFLMACRGQIPATVGMTSDTGWEFDRVWSNGRRAPAHTYFEEVVLPVSKKYGFDSRMVRSCDKAGVPLPGLRDYVTQVARSGNLKGLNIPLFGSRKGRLTQRCTDKMKIRAINQELRRMGAKTACKAMGIHLGEADRRVKGIYLRNDGPWSIYQTNHKAQQERDRLRYLARAGGYTPEHSV